MGFLVLSLIFLFNFFPKRENFYLLFSQSKSDKDCFLKQKHNFAFQILQLPTIEKNSFLESVPVTVLETNVFGTLIDQTPERKEIIEYTVEKGDTLSQIAQKFEVSLETILWANDLKKTSKIKPGQKLIILPVSGVMHLVKNGETVSEIAKKYKANVSEIIAFNGLSPKGEIFVGDMLIIPGGVLPKKSFVQSAPLASSYFICPIPAPCQITQGLHWYNAVDFSHGKCGEPVFAAAGGKIQKTGFDPVAGKYIRILHPNGVVTFYGHLLTILKTVGEKVSQGEIIGYIGNSGYTVGVTGCHLHFEVRGAKNPFAK